MESQRSLSFCWVEWSACTVLELSGLSAVSIIAHPNTPFSACVANLQALYRGNGANVLRLVPEVGFKYALHEQLQVLFAPSDGSLPGVSQKLVTSSATGT